MMPVQNTMGRKAATVVAVDAATAMPTSFVPATAASAGRMPSSMCR